ncbi:tannase/feruloyl esterase family alpha/beta hydrolase [Saccharopolyspora sp. K220]|uniref:tannase/feruloyl esterase family alpha/beta hydrolase n=1 Tax=Saccharopolyspora soli TaxID=2926618 RepID=UPI001F5A0B85|nr:tannase/feruloyl esterase family alpha/beta hydrolase [Saccharopolyspora soli]MCI2424178.1 tannase/feruloyl esterase family alpha/beta hydrolase [Saccharopolyspora soli]
MRRVLKLVAAVLLLPVLVPFSAGAAAKPADPAPLACSAMSVSAPPGAGVESVTAVRQEGGTVTFPVQPPSTEPPPPITGVPAYCDITVTLNHPGANDHARVKVLLPESGWTGRFQAVGGSGYAAGDFGAPLVAAVKNGYAAASTDAGVTLSFLDTSAWALTADGQVNLPLLQNFASRSMHDLAVVGKEVTAKFYGRAADFSYWNGCSTGGRQGYVEAQQHPDDFDGILANAPAINWDRFAVATLWPQVVMNQEHNFPTACEFKAFKDAAVQSCDAHDGVTDGIIGQPQNCDYDPKQLVGKTIVCDGEQVTISAADADVVRKIWDGPQPLWFGLPEGADFSGLASTVTAADGTMSAPGFPIAKNWVQTFLKQQPDFDTATISYDQFTELFRQSQRQYNDIIGTDDPDLSAFREAGGKMITWQGLADTLIPPQGTIDYRQRVDQVMGGTSRVDSFYRLFLAPGVAHCGGGTGPVPTDALAALVNWVEHGTAPNTLPAAATDATGKTVTRDLCRYPKVASYTGHGDPADAASYRCTTP